MQIDPANQIEKQYWYVSRYHQCLTEVRSTKDPRYCWRALRLLSRSHLHYFAEFNSAKQSYKVSWLAILCRFCCTMSLLLCQYYVLLSYT